MRDPIYHALHDLGIPNLEGIPIMFAQLRNEGAEAMIVRGPQMEDLVNGRLFQVVRLLQYGCQQVGHILGYWDPQGLWPADHRRHDLGEEGLHRWQSALLPLSLVCHVVSHLLGESFYKWV